MASKPKVTAEAAPRKRPARAHSTNATKSTEGAGSTREAVRDIVRRYRDTFERLGR